MCVRTLLSPFGDIIITKIAFDCGAPKEGSHPIVVVRASFVVRAVE